MAIPTESVSQCLHPGHASLSRCAREVLGSRDEPAVSRTSAQWSGILQNFQTEFREILGILKTHEILWDFNWISLKFESVFGDCIQICVCVCVEQSIHRWMDGWMASHSQPGRSCKNVLNQSASALPGTVHFFYLGTTYMLPIFY